MLSTSMNQEKIQPRKSQWQLTWVRLWRNRMALVGLFIIALFLFTALLAPLFAPYDPLKQDLLSIRAGISSKHWLGCDQVG